MSRESMQYNEIQDMRNSMKLNFINHLRQSKKPMPHTMQLYTQVDQRLSQPLPFTFKVKDKTLNWTNVNKINGARLTAEGKFLFNSKFKFLYFIKYQLLNRC